MFRILIRVRMILPGSDTDPHEFADTDPHEFADPDPQKNADPDPGQKGKERNE